MTHEHSHEHGHAHDHEHGHEHGHGHAHEHHSGAAVHAGHPLGPFAGPAGIWIGVFLLWALGTGIVVALFKLIRKDPAGG